MLRDLVAEQHLSLEGIRWCDRKLGDGGAELDLTLRDTLEASTWTVHCSFVIDYRFEAAPIDAVVHVTEVEHPLLARYADMHASLFFRGTIERPRDLVGALLEEHREACAEWISFDSLLEEHAMVALAQGHGLLARGPRRLLERYATVLERHGLEPSLVGGQPFQELRGGQRQPRTRPAEALVLGRRSYVVADSFTAKRR
jgi:hypothetical protein